MLENVADFSHDRNELAAVGHAVIAIFKVAVLIAIVAVVLSPRSKFPDLIRAFFALLAWLVEQVIRPIAGGTNTGLSTKLGTAGANPTTSLGGPAGTDTSGNGVGTGDEASIDVSASTPHVTTGTGLLVQPGGNGGLPALAPLAPLTPLGR